MIVDFSHRQSAHCETGVTANLLRHHGVDLSEAMAFGIGGGLFYGYIPFIKLNYLPLITYRKRPGDIFRSATRRLGAEVKTSRFRNQKRGMDALDSALESEIPVGVQTSVYWLPYMPPALRFHFNAHNIVVFGKQGSDYLISDPVLESPVVCPAEDLQRARFAEGDLAPKGRMYYLRRVPQTCDLKPAIRAGIHEVCRNMVKNPIPLLGVRGIRRLANRLEAWPKELPPRKALQHLGHVIRMQEEIGTGGGGFRLMYSAFLQESAKIIGTPALTEMSEKMTEIGDLWREFAVLGARVCKGREEASGAFPLLAELLRTCADREGDFFRELGRIVG